MPSFSHLLDMSKTLVRALRRPKIDADAYDSFGQRVAKNAAQHGDALALVCEGEQLTWAMLNARANRVASVLKQQGVTNGDCVALLMENRTEFLITLIGIVKLGATAGLMNTNQRQQVLVHSLATVNAKKCIAGAECWPAIQDVRNEIALTKDDLFVVADGDIPLPPDITVLDSNDNALSADNPAATARVQLRQAAFFILTSGTTGLPKAALFSHARFVNAAYGFGEIMLRLTPQDRIYLCLPLYHATALTCAISTATQSHASVVLRRKFSASQFWSEIRDNHCTAFVYIGELCRYLINQPAQPNDATQPAKKCIGNGLRPDIWLTFKSRFGITRIGEFYGASEGNNVFINAFNRDQTIGFPVLKSAVVRYDVEGDAIVRNSDGRCQEVNTGEPGLLLNKVEGEAQFEGYTSKAANEAKLVRDVFERGDVYFNTGDLIKQIDVGFAFGRPHYQFVDRVGDTFRWKGENCSTNEIAEVINALPQVAVTNVYGVQVPGSDGRAGMAAIQFDPASVVNPADIDWRALSAHIAQALPSYARPVFIRVLREAETTSTFKLVKKDLREQAFHAGQIGDDEIYVLKPGSTRYERLDHEFEQKIATGTAGY